MRRPPSPRSIATFDESRRITRPREDLDDDDADDGFRFFVWSLATPEEEASFYAFLARRTFLILWPLHMLIRVVEVYGHGLVSTGLDDQIGRAWTALLFGVTVSAIVGSPAWVRPAMVEHPFALVVGARFINHLRRGMRIASSTFDSERVAATLESTAVLFCVPLLNSALTPLLGGGLSRALFVFFSDVIFIPSVVAKSIGDAAVADLMMCTLAGAALGNLAVFFIFKPTWASAVRVSRQRRRLRRRLRALEPQVAALRNMAD